MSVAPFDATLYTDIQFQQVGTAERPRIDIVRLVVVCSLLVMMCLNVLEVGYAATLFARLLF